MSSAECEGPKQAATRIGGLYGDPARRQGDKADNKRENKTPPQTPQLEQARFRVTSPEVVDTGLSIGLTRAQCWASRETVGTYPYLWGRAKAERAETRPRAIPWHFNHAVPCGFLRLVDANLASIANRNLIDMSKGAARHSVPSNPISTSLDIPDWWGRGRKREVQQRTEQQVIRGPCPTFGDSGRFRSRASHILETNEIAISSIFFR